MLIKKKTGIEIPSSEITPEHIYLSRRKFMVGAAAVAGAVALSACKPKTVLRPSAAAVAPAVPTTTTAPGVTPTIGPTGTPDEFAAYRGVTDELGAPLTAYDAVIGYNNYYEFTTNKQAVAGKAEGYQTSPWDVIVSGMVRNPRMFDMDELLSEFDQEERIYRLRCVEGWSMAIPWTGFPLAKLLEMVEPTSQAKYVRFETVYDPQNMPGQNSPFYVWPYVEGLRLDEAMNDLAFLATGLYGRSLLPQSGAPVRLAVPWKYGFKSIKSIVKIQLTDEMPTSLWMNAASNEYGFYANVNPEVSHPRWSQSSERRIGEFGRQPTLMFNGYEEQVAALYDGMDLTVNF